MLSYACTVLRNTLSIPTECIVLVVTTSECSGGGARLLDVMIVGAGGLGQEARDAVESSRSLCFVGFLDDDPDLPDVVGAVSPVEASRAQGLLIAIGDPRTRRAVRNRLGTDVRYVSVVHASAVVSPSATIGAGCLIGALAYVGPRAIVGDHVLVNVHAEVGHDSRLERYVTLSPLSATNGGAVLGEGVFLGTHASVGVGVSIGRWTKVAAGARVVADVGEGFLVAGNPAQGRRMFTPDGV